MTITKTALRTAVNNRTNRNETQAVIDVYLKAILNDVCVTGPFLRTSASLSFAASVSVADMPADYRTAEAVAGLIEKSFFDLLAFSNTLTTEGTPEFYAVHDKKLHIWPTPSTSTSVTVHYTQIDDDVDTIALADEFQECLTEGCVYKLYEDKGMNEEAAAHKGLYDEQLAKLTAIYGKA